jgi:hypothetical protein
MRMTVYKPGKTYMPFRFTDFTPDGMEADPTVTILPSRKPIVAPDVMLPLRTSRTFAFVKYKGDGVDSAVASNCD